MSKYVRTDRGIYEIESVFVNNEGEFVGYNIVDDFMIILRNQVVKSADTIEELCDGFIFKDTCANELHLVNQNGGISMLGATLFKETLRGFIETDTGLIYVAKLNDKGEFELL